MPAIANPKIVDLQNKIKANHEAVSAHFDKVDEELAKDATYIVPKAEFDAVKDLNKETEGLEAQLSDLLEMEGIRSGNERRGRDLKQVANQLPFAGGDDPREGGSAMQIKSIGDAVVSDKEMAEFMKNLPHAAKKAPLNSPAVNLGGSMMSTLITGASQTSAGALFRPDRKPGFDMGTFMRPLTLRDIITVGTTDSDVVEFVRMTGYTNNAAPVAEATATAGVSGAKPESAAALEVVQANVKTIAHWLAATRRAIADAGQLRTLIDTLLMYGLQEELEDQIANGSGVGENFTGVLNASGTTTQAFVTDRIVTARKARTKVRTTGRATATAFVMHPNDWEAMDLLTDNEHRYYYGGPAQLGIPRLWGLPVVECEGFPQGTGMVADWKLAVLWDRQQSSIITSESHADFFTRNMVAVLAELRAAFGIIRPAAFVEIAWA